MIHFSPHFILGLGHSELFNIFEFVSCAFKLSNFKFFCTNCIILLFHFFKYTDTLHSWLIKYLSVTFKICFLTLSTLSLCNRILCVQKNTNWFFFFFFFLKNLFIIILIYLSTLVKLMNISNSSCYFHSFFLSNELYRLCIYFCVHVYRFLNEGITSTSRPH